MLCKQEFSKKRELFGKGPKDDLSVEARSTFPLVGRGEFKVS